MEDIKSIKAQLNELRKKIRHYNKKYYEDDNPEISDYEYDQLMLQLKQIEAGTEDVVKWYKFDVKEDYEYDLECEFDEHKAFISIWSEPDAAGKTAGYSYWPSLYLNTSSDGIGYIKVIVKGNTDEDVEAETGYLNMDSYLD